MTDVVDPVRAAGVLFQTPDGRVLTLRRTDEGHYWSLPGGRVEEGETEEDAARREVEEETGRHYAGPLKPLTRRVKDGVDFTAFLAPDAFEFEPTLNAEHDLSRWAYVEDVIKTGGTHPGLDVVLERGSMDELAVAQAIRDGELVSPQRYMNTLLVALRVTGTGVSYRTKDDEYVWRDPAMYLNDEFLARCQGLTVIVEHPKTQSLTATEFHDRAVGSIMLPYLKGDEVWGVAKIYDDVIARMLETDPLSTSPAVVFKANEEGVRQLAPDGKAILIEGKPALLDHLAICVQGVWDKGGPPAGVSNPTTEGDTTMADEKKDDAGGMPTDPQGGSSVDKILTHLDGLHKKFDEGMSALHARMDGFEEKYGEKKDDEGKAGDPPPAAGAEMDDDTKKDDDKEEKKDDAEGEDKEKKDDAEEEGEKKDDAEPTDKKDDDMSKNDSQAGGAGDLAARVKALEAHVVELKPEERARFTAAQAKADPVYHVYGDSAPRFLAGETINEYRKRMIRNFQQHSKAWKGADITGINDESTLQNIEDVVFADAISAAKTPMLDGEPSLRMVTERDGAGREIRRFFGHPEACWGQFKGSGARLVGINKQSDRL